MGLPEDIYDNRGFERQPPKRGKKVAITVLALTLGSGIYFGAHAGTAPSAAQQLRPAATPGAALQETSPPTSGSVTNCITQLPLKTRVAQLLMPGIYNDTAHAVTPLFRAQHIGGALVMSGPDDVQSAVFATFKEKTGALIASDEEGGNVQRFRVLGELPSAREMADTLAPGQVTTLIADYGKKLKTQGVDMVLGPVVDVAPPTGEGPMNNRTFSSSPQKATAYAQAVINGWRQSDIMPVIKHFPGHGSATADTHETLATTPPLSRLKNRDLFPYSQLAKANTGVMVGHLVVPGLTQGQPASLSPRAIQLLRNQLGYHDNLIMSDALNMGAITKFQSSLGESAVKVVAAGGDMIVFVPPADHAASELKKEVTAIQRAFRQAIADGQLSEQRINQSAARVFAAKQLDPCQIVNRQQ